MKIVLKKTGEEIQMGTILHLTFITPTGVVKQDVEVNMENLVRLQQVGIITVTITEDENQLSLFNLGGEEGVLANMALKNTIPAINMDPNFYLDSFDETPATDALVQGGMEFLLLIHIAVLIDRRYTRNIKESKEIYWCNPTNGKVEQLDKKTLKVKSFNKFPAFRTKEDAIAALKILSSIRKIVKNNGK